MRRQRTLAQTAEVYDSFDSSDFSGSREITRRGSILFFERMRVPHGMDEIVSRVHSRHRRPQRCFVQAIGGNDFGRGGDPTEPGGIASQSSDDVTRRLKRA
jgi:hypothetical protein